MALPVAHEYTCLMVPGYKSPETKKIAHLKCMRGRYVVLYASQLPAAGTHFEGRLPQTGLIGLGPVVAPSRPAAAAAAWWGRGRVPICVVSSDNARELDITPPDAHIHASTDLQQLIRSKTLEWA
jgi:hypothetical protein